MEGLVNILVPSAGTVSKDDIKLLKEKVFGPSTFWITETKPTDDILEGGVVVGLFSHVTSNESCTPYRASSWTPSVRGHHGGLCIFC